MRHAMPRITPMARSASASIPTTGQWGLRHMAALHGHWQWDRLPARSFFRPCKLFRRPSANFSGVEYYPRNMPTTYVEQFLFSVQHEFAGGLLLDTSYVYTRGRNLNFSTDTNQAPVSALGCTGYNCGNPNPVFN